MNPRGIGDAYITSMGAFLPGPAIPNERLEDILGRIGGKPSRLGPKVLRSNGIKTRHYAMDDRQKSTHQNTELAAEAARACLARSSIGKDKVDMLAVATTQGDLALPGMASMVQGELALPPCEILTTHGICGAGIQALKGAANQVRLGEKRNALVCASELSSRLLKASRYEASGRGTGGEGLDFESEFLRFMLSDGAGAMLVQDRPAERGLSLRIDWIEVMSFAGDYPVCMKCGSGPPDGAHKTWQDYPTYGEAERDGALLIRQDLKLLENVVKVGVEGYLRLIQAGRIRSDEIDHFACHYSSHYFRGKTLELMRLMGCLIPEERWFTNLYEKGNTGCAALFIMLEELLYNGSLKPGQTVFCFVPESGRFLAAYMRLTVVAGEIQMIAKDPTVAPGLAAQELMRELVLVWLGFERRLAKAPVVERIEEGRVTAEEYRALLRNLRAQVVEGARWITRAASNFGTDHLELRSEVIGHAQEEHRDYEMLDKDYAAMGGDVAEMRRTPRNIGTEALSAFMFQQASQPDPVDLLGAMFIIEGLGNHMAARWAGKIQSALGVGPECTRFLGYHGANDERHLEKLANIAGSKAVNHGNIPRIVKTAKVVARLYILQLEELDHV